MCSAICARVKYVLANFSDKETPWLQATVKNVLGNFSDKQASSLQATVIYVLANSIAASNRKICARELLR